jgi:hypothetical protein
MIETRLKATVIKKQERKMKSECQSKCKLLLCCLLLGMGEDRMTGEAMALISMSARMFETSDTIMEVPRHFWQVAD